MSRGLRQAVAATGFVAAIVYGAPTLAQPCNRNCPVAQRGPDGCCVGVAPPRPPHTPRGRRDGGVPTNTPPPPPPPQASAGTGASCADPIALVADQTISGTTVGGGSQFQGTCGGSTAPERVHALRVSQPGTYFVDVTQTDFDGIVYLRAACAVEGSESRCNDDLGDTRHSALVVSLEPGTYYVLTDGLGSGGAGGYSLTVRPIGASCTWTDLDACVRFASAVERGTAGATADPSRAESWFQSACDRGSASGCTQLNRIRANRAVRERGDMLSACPEGVSMSWRERPCGWRANGDARTCTPGTTVRIGCGAACGLGANTGDPVLVVCDGDAPCLGANALAADDDGCGNLGSLATFTCPSSGRYTAFTSSIGGRAEYSCTLAVGTPTAPPPGPQGAAGLLAPCADPGAERDCGWIVSGPARSCAPGAPVRVGCGGPNCEPGAFEGDPVLRACEGTAPCAAAAALDSQDDTCGPGPVVTFNCPASGVYNLLVGAYSPNRTYSCTIGGATDRVVAAAPASGAYGGPLLVGGAVSNFGRIDLGAGQPSGALHVVSGGQLDARASTGCIGWVTGQPDAIVSVAGGLPLLELAVTADNAPEDTTLVVHRPDGTWACNDDFAPPARDPRVDIESPPAGQYDVWVGSYAQGQFLAGTLAATTSLGGAPGVRVAPGSAGCASCAVARRDRAPSSSALVAGLAALGLVGVRARRRRARRFLRTRPGDYHPVGRCT